MKTKSDEFAPGNPIVSAWISSDGRYAFAEFRTAEEASMGFILAGSVVQGQTLKVGRPKTYSGSIMDIPETNISNTVAAVLHSGVTKKEPIMHKIQYPTKILCFKDICKDLNIDDEDEYNFIKEDIQLECEQFAKVVNVFLPRKDIEDNIIPGMGNAYVEFENINDCKTCRKNLSGRRYNGKLINMKYFDEDKYSKGNYNTDIETE